MHSHQHDPLSTPVLHQSVSQTPLLITTFLWTYVHFRNLEFLSVTSLVTFMKKHLVNNILTDMFPQFVFFPLYFHCKVTLYITLSAVLLLWLLSFHFLDVIKNLHYLHSENILYSFVYIVFLSLVYIFIHVQYLHRHTFYDILF